VCPHFYSSRGARTKTLNPDMWTSDITDGTPRAIDASHLARSPCAPISAACVALACSRSFPSNVQVMMTMARAKVWAYCPLFDWTGMPPVGWPGRRLPVEWMGLIKCRGGTSPVSRADRRRVFSTINVEIAWPRGLTSGSARWLTSRTIGHVAASGLRLSGERKRSRQSPDRCLRRTPVRP
jgi:hypothetical protein